MNENGGRLKLQKAPGANCDICPLLHEKFVPTSGPANPRYMVVGEAPGFQETLRGQPFVGPSGKLMKRVLRRNGIDPAETSFSNVVACRPPGNVDPDKEAVACCAPRLQTDIKQRSPQVLFATGGIASKAILNNRIGIMAARVGPPKAIEHYSNVKIIPTVHPAFVLRAPLNLAFLETDVGKAQLPPTEWIPPVYWVPESVGPAIKVLNAIERQGNPIAIDIEVAIDKETDFEHPSQYDLLCLGIAYDPGHVVVLPAELLLDPEVGWAIRNLLSHTPIIAQNGKFDLPGLSNFGEFHLSDDTLLASYALDERPGTHSLDYLGREFVGAPDWKGEIAGAKSGPDGFGGIPPDSLHRYNAYDCAITYRVHDLLQQRLKDDGLLDLYAFLVRASNALMKVEQRGLLVDQEYLETLEFKYTEKLQGMELALKEWVVNPRSWQQVQKALKDLGVTTASTDESHLRDILDHAAGLIEYSPQGAKRVQPIINFVEKLLDYRHEQKRYGTYIKGTRERLYYGRIYPSYLLHGTRTGRLSSRNPNIQNVPRGHEIRRLIVPDPGKCFIQGDYAQGEWRLVTTLAGCTYFRDLFNDPTADPVGEVQQELFGHRVNASDPEVKKFFRTRTKNIVYGSFYGMIMGRGKEGVKYAKFMQMTNDEAYAYQKRFFGLAPEIVRWQEETRQRVMDGEILETTFGRRLRIPAEILVMDDKARIDALNECLAFVPQSTLSDICLYALCDLVDMGAPIAITIHDALIAECRVDNVDSVAVDLRHAMEESAKLNFTDYVPFPVEIKTGTNWGELG